MLILSGEIVFAERLADMCEGLQLLTLGMQRFPLAAPEAARSPDRLDTMLLIGFGDRREAQDLPGLLCEDMADEIVLMQALHDVIIAPLRLSFSRL